MIYPRPRRLHVGGAVIEIVVSCHEFSGAHPRGPSNIVATSGSQTKRKPPLHRHEVGGGDMGSVSALEQNHPSTDMKWAGAMWGACPLWSKIIPPPT